MKMAAYVAVGVLLAALVGIGAWWWWHAPVPPAPTTPAAPVALAVPTPEPPPASAASIRHPIDVPTAAEPGTALPDIETALVELFGRKSVLALFQVDGFVRRVVATETP